MDRREKETLDRHITGNYLRDGMTEDEIADGMFQWEPGTLASKVVERILVDALADVWQDCYRRDDAAGRIYQRNLFREKVTEAIRRNLFREKVTEAIRCATGEGMRVT